MRSAKIFAALVVSATIGIAQAADDAFSEAMQSFREAGAKKAVEVIQGLGGKETPETEYVLGLIYESGNAGVPVDRQKAEAWFSRAAKRGFPRAMLHLGQLLANEGINAKNKGRFDVGCGWLKAAYRAGVQEADSTSIMVERNK